jgi:cytochrome P450
VIAADEMVGKTDPQIARGRPAAEVMWTGLTTLREYSAEYAARKRAAPGEDLMSSLVQAEIDGSRLTDDEIGAFFVLLAVAGLDTTRHTASYAIKALTDFPNQRRLLMDDLPGRLDTAVDEFIRWASPVMNFRRTTTRDTELAGQPIAEGEKVVMFYSSANRDELAFEHPEQFDILRSPEPARRLRRRRPPLLSRQPAGAHAAEGPLPRAADTRPGDPGRRTGVRGQRLHPRHPAASLHDRNTRLTRPPCGGGSR